MERLPARQGLITGRPMTFDELFFSVPPFPFVSTPYSKKEAGRETNGKALEPL